MVILRILIVVALQTAALAYMIVDRQAMLNASRVVTLKVVPIDPNDMFRGDYVTLHYAISQLDFGKLQGDDAAASGDIIYVTLEKQADSLQWTPVAVAHGRPFVTQRGVALRGTVTSVNASKAGQPPDRVDVDYGIESYFVPQGTGKEIEDECRKGEVNVDIAVDAQGRGAIKAMRRKDGQPFYVEGIF